MQKIFAINGDAINGTVSMELKKDKTGRAFVVAYLPAGITSNDMPEVIRTNLKARCDSIKKRFHLVQIS